MHNVSVEADFITPGTEGPYAGWDGPSCDPAQEGVCQWAGHETMYPTDDVLFRGTFLDETVVRPDTEDGFFAGGTWTFTGSIVGCNGEGNVVFPWTGAADEDPTTTITPDTSGRVLHGHDLLWSPTNMTGLVVSAAFIDAEYYANPIDVSITRGHLSGYIVCEWDGAPAPGTQQP